MYRYEFEVVTERFKVHKLVSTDRETYNSAESVAAAVMDVARSLESVPSGMEGFGEGICVLEDKGHECAENYPQCQENEYEGARREILKRVEELGAGKTEEFHFTHGHDWASVVVSVLVPEPEEDEE